MRNLVLCGAAWLMAYVAMAQQVTANETALRPEEAATEFMSYTAREAARADDYAASPYYKSLDGAGEFTVPFAWADKQIFLHIGSCDPRAAIEVNDRSVEVEDPRNPSEFDITNLVKEGRNSLKISDGKARRMYLKALPKVHVRDFDIRTNLTDGYRNGVLDFGVIVQSHLLNEKQARVYFEFFSPDGELLKSESKEVTLRMRQQETVHFEAMVPDVMAWNSEHPNLYSVMIRVQYEGRFAEYIQRPVAFRSVELVDGRLLVNGETMQSDSVYRMSEANVRDVPGNDPEYTEAMINRVKANYLRNRNDPSVVAFSLGDSDENGYNFYEAYRWMKAHETERPVIFRGAGREWNTDVVENLTLSGQ